jgi:hypothetical protein
MRKMCSNRRTLIIRPRPYGPRITHMPLCRPFMLTHTPARTTGGWGWGEARHIGPPFLCGSDDATAALIQISSHSILFYSVSSKFVLSLAPLLVGNYTNRPYDQNTDPSSGCLSVGAVTRNVIGVHKHETPCLMYKQCVTFVFQSQPGCYGYDRAWSVSDDTSWNELKPLS